MSTVELGDLVVHYRQRGSGPAVVLLHGLAEDHRSRDAVAASLDGFTTYAVDLRGHGQTSTGQGSGTLRQLSDDLTAFLNAVSGPAAVVGYSLGGTVGLDAATAAEAPIRHLVVVATSSVVGAAEDVFCPRRAADIITAALPHGRYHEIAGAGHLVSVDQPVHYGALLARLLHEGIAR